MRDETDVLVVGVGPVGLMLAGEAAAPAHRPPADRARAGAITSYGVVAPDARPPDLERRPLVIDAEDGVRSTYGLGGSARCLIHSDAYVGYRASPPDPEWLDAYLRRILTPKPG